MLFLLFLIICTVALPLIGSFTFWPVTHPYDFYIPIVLAIAGAFAGILIIWIFLDISGRITTNTKKTYEKPTRFNRFCLNQGMSLIRRLCLIVVKAKGKEKIPATQKYLLVCNHRSNFDNFVITDKLAPRQDLAFITKGSNYKIPLAKFHMRRLGYPAIDRKDLLQSLQVMKSSSDRIQKGYTSIAVFPEGTRSKDGNMGNFHEGVFNIAIKAQCPIVVCAIKGTENTRKRWPRITKVKLNVATVLDYEDYRDQPAKAVSDRCKEIIQNELNKM